MTQQNSIHQDPPRFWIGQFNMTDEARLALNAEGVLTALRRHNTGDWGDLCAEDREANETSLRFGGRLFSVYHDRKGVKFWIITQADRNMTTVFLPADY